MTDLHTHLLHKIDDGADSIETSKKMLDKMCETGISTAVCTPHFDFTNVSPAQFIDLRENRIEQLYDYARQKGIKLLKGCELKLTSRVLNLESVADLCIENTRNILIEMPFAREWNDSTFDLLTNFIDYFNVTPVIAHVERYLPVIKNVKVAEKLVEHGAILQLDASSLFEKQYSKTAKKLLKYELISVVASDCHNTDTRPPEILKAAYNQIGETCKNGAVDYMKNFADKLCEN